jgi:SAM-dependent methyltransferase
MLSMVSPIVPLSSKIVEQLQKIDDFFICTSFTEDMIGPPVVRIGNDVFFRFMNYIFLPQPPESLTTEQVKRICDVRLEYFDELVNHQLNASVVDSITNCVRARQALPVTSLKALDFGCGSGLSSQMLLNRIPKLDLIGVDISENAISLCREQSISAQLIALEELLPFGMAEFDLIFAVFVMHFNVDIQMLAELYRILKPAGLFVFNVYQRDIDGLRAQLEEVGFCSIDLWERLSHIGNNHVVMSCRSMAT